MIPVDAFGEQMAALTANVSASRARQGLPPLNGYDGNDGQIAIGQERLNDELDAPRIVLVPQGWGSFKNEMRMPNPPTLTMADNQPKVLWSAGRKFTAYYWGDEWPGGTPKPIWWDYNTARELMRELVSSLYRVFSGPAVPLEDAEFEQPTDQARRGRWLVQNFAILDPITDEPYVTLPYGAHPKVEIDLTMDPAVDATITIPS